MLFQIRQKYVDDSVSDFMREFLIAIIAVILVINAFAS